MGYSRVEAGKHYPVDVAAGAAIGILSSHLLVRPFKGWSLQPVADGRGYGVQLVKGW